MLTLAISNQKGGVGKTALTRNLGAILAESGLRVLLVDLDPQSSLTAACGVSTAGDLPSLADVLGGAQPGRLAAVDVLQELGGGLWLIPADINLAGSELGLVSRLGRESVLRRALVGLADRFDLVILDCPPSLGLLTVCGLAAANAVLIPTQPQAQDLRGVVLFLETIKTIRAELNPALQVLGVVVNTYDSRLTHHKAAIDALRANLPILGMIGRSVRVAESAGAGQPLHVYEPGNPQVENYRALAEHIKSWLKSSKT